MEDNQFSWIPFYTELADKLLAYKNRRKELLDIVYSLDDAYVHYLYDNGKHFDNIDPFSVFGIFNRGGSKENRIKICEVFKSKFNIKSEVPQDFAGIPIMMQLKSYFFYIKENDADKAIEYLWNLFESAINKNENDFDKYFDLAQTTHGIKWNITFGLFWIRPNDFISLDGNNRRYLKEKYNIEVSEEYLKAANYRKLEKEIKAKMESGEIKGNTFPHFSYDAWTFSKGKNYWLVGYSFGSTDSQLDYFYKKNIWIGIFDKKDKKQIELAENIKIGDILVLKSTGTKGAAHNQPFLRTKAIGIVEQIMPKKQVKNEYEYSYKVNYIYKEERDFDGNEFGAFRKTIHNLTNKDILKYVNKIINGDEIEKNNYWIIAANENKYNHTERFQKYGYIDWAIKNNIAINDIIYIYSTKPFQEIKYKTIVEDKKIQKGEPLYKITIISESKNPINLQTLQQYGIKGRIQGPRNITNNNDLLNLLNKSFDENTNIMSNNQYISLLKANHNLIFTGAPGTGKTFLAKQIACQMRYGKDYENLSAEEKKDYDDLKNFVQFHPSYDYTDFVEGLRPKQDDNGNMGFERCDGVFKAFCIKALENNNFNTLNDAIEKFKAECSGEGNEVVIKTVTGIKFSVAYRGGRTFRVRSEKSKVAENRDFPVNIEKIKRLYSSGNKFMYNLSYGRGILDYLKTKYKISEYKNINNDKPFIFIIDEINRGEISKIFGELFFSIDPGYRGEEGKVQTQYQNLIDDDDPFNSGFYVPKNVYIIGTMNDIDRSVESMDFAMRRRFVWCEISADESAENMNLPEDAKARMKRLNTEISKIEDLNDSYFIGGAYFRNCTNFDELWNLKLCGLLKEYMRGTDKADENLKKLKAAYDNEIDSSQE